MIETHNQEQFRKMDVIVVGAGPAGLSAAMYLKKRRPELDICVLDKEPAPGNHNLSGAALEAATIERLLDEVASDWREDERAIKVLSRRVDKDSLLFLAGSSLHIPIAWSVKLARLLRLGFGQLQQHGDYVVSVSELCSYLAEVAAETGVEVYTGFAVDEVLLDADTGRAQGVKLVDQGLNEERQPQPNYVEGEQLQADFVILAEGCDGLATEKFISAAVLEREREPLYSIGVKEVYRVSDEQYTKYHEGRSVHAMGWPIWTPVVGPALFGGGVMYAMGDNRIAVGMIVGLDWDLCDFNPQDALVRFRQHKFVRQFIEGGTLVEAGAKMIPEGGYYAIPRYSIDGSVGKKNVMILGDSAGFVNMLKIKGLHNAIESGMAAAEAINENLEKPDLAAKRYTERLEARGVMDEMRKAAAFRQTVMKLGPLLGFPISVLGGLLPKWKTPRDYEIMSSKRYRLKPEQTFDKDTFTAMANTQHREEQPCHLDILDPLVCVDCGNKYSSPCITFCPAGVYETVQGQVKAANPSNCLHCKTCQRKCPYDNILWTAPEGGGGPKYKTM